jgi:hypothetical protein
VVRSWLTDVNFVDRFARAELVVDQLLWERTEGEQIHFHRYITGLLDNLINGAGTLD